MSIPFDPGVFKSLADAEPGRSLWPFFNRQDVVVRMKTASDLGRPALEGVEEPLLETFEQAILEDRIKQMMGRMVRQVMERHGYEIAAQNVKMSGAPFSRATRYRRRDHPVIHVWRHPDDPRDHVLTSDRAGGRLPELDHGAWQYWTTFQGALRGVVAFGVPDFKNATADIQAVGFHRFRRERLLRAAAS